MTPLHFEGLNSSWTLKEISTGTVRGVEKCVKDSHFSRPATFVWVAFLAQYSMLKLDNRMRTF